MLSSALISCIAPPYPTDGWVDVGLLSFGTPLRASLSFYYTRPVYSGTLGGDDVRAIYPEFGPTAGGTVVTVTVSNTFNADAMCRFGARGSERGTRARRKNWNGFLLHARCDLTYPCLHSELTRDRGGSACK